ncbi:MAG: ethanolamine utilization protein EutH [Clostridia bacterium]|nr:ethanolamine utilization protein EutH [Clostridia bacterium]
MNYLTIVILIFSILAAVDRILGNRFGLATEFERAFMLLGTMALSMIGMIVISPLIADLMKPLSEFFTNVLHMDPSIIPATLFANDMGGAPLAVEMATNERTGLYNALVVSSMMGCTISFTLPFSLGVVGKEQHRELLLGLLCGVVTIPIGCIIAGIMYGIPFGALMLNLLPIIVFSAVIGLGLMRFPEKCVTIFKVFGVIITAIITIGLSLGIVRFLTGYEVIKGLSTIEEGAAICVNAAVVLSGSFPLMYVLSKVLSKPLDAVGKKIGVNEISVVGIVSALASSATSFGMMNRMDKKGVVLNSAFAVSGAFVLGGHLAFTMAFDSSLVAPVVVGKLISGVLSVVVASFVFDKIQGEKK